MDFVDCLIHLNDNFLREFNAEVYQPVLEAMFESNLVKPHRGAIFINSSKMDIDKFLSALFFQKNLISLIDPIRCDCNLSWLIRDRRHLLPFVRGASCANSTRFGELNPYGFNHCTSTDNTNEHSNSLAYCRT